MPTKILTIKEYSKKLSDYDIANRKKFLPVRPFEERTQIFGIIEIDKNYQGVERPIGFFCSAMFGEQTKFTAGYLPSRKHRIDDLKDLAGVLLEKNKLLNSNPLALVYTVAMIEMNHGTQWSYPFTFFQIDLRWAYDVVYRRVIIFNKIIDNMIFAY